MFRKLLIKIIQRKLEKDGQFHSELLNYLTNDCPYEDTCRQEFMENCDRIDECVQEYWESRY